MACEEFPLECDKCPYEVECDKINRMEWSIWYECQHEIRYYRAGKYLIGECKLCGYLKTMRLYYAELDDDRTTHDPQKNNLRASLAVRH